MSAFSKQLHEAALDLLWSLWAELGVSSWEGRHADWCIDPEPLIVLTAALGERDPRLRDESTDWCVRHARYVSAARLKNALPLFREDAARPFGEYAATVNAHAGVRWAHTRAGPPSRARPFQPTGRSHVHSFDRPSQLALRLRALFGVGARAEIARGLLTLGQPPRGITASDFPDALYTRRNVAEELESLRLAGLLVALASVTRRVYVLRDPEPLRAIAAPLPTAHPRWTVLLPLLYDLLAYASTAASLSTLARAVEAKQLAVRCRNDLLTAGVPILAGFAAAPGVDAATDGEAAVAHSFEEWALGFVRALSGDRPHGATHVPDRLELGPLRARAPKRRHRRLRRGGPGRR